MSTYKHKYIMRPLTYSLTIFKMKKIQKEYNPSIFVKIKLTIVILI